MLSGMISYYYRNTKKYTYIFCLYEKHANTFRYLGIIGFIEKVCVLTTFSKAATLNVEEENCGHE